MAMTKGVLGYEGLYRVSSDGKIFALPKTVKVGEKIQHRKGKTLKPGMRGKKGLMYKFVVLSDGKGDTEKKAVHRLVAEAFIPNPNGLPEVNHKDQNTMNNSVENLEWCTRQYNTEYSKAKKVEQYEINGTKVRDYKSIVKAADATKIARRAINNALKGWAKTAGGYCWKYCE